MKYGILLLVLLTIFVQGIDSPAVIAGTVHTAYGDVYNSDSSQPADGDITFVAYITARPEEQQTQTSTGCGYGSGQWWVQVGNFPSDWTAGEILRVDVTNTVNGETGTVDVEMTNEGNDKAPDLHLEFVVPVELSSFNVTTIKNQVVLEWATETESNNFGFEIQRKSEKNDFSKIGFVPGNGTTTTPQSYNYTDGTVTSGAYYYRLKQIDHDGSFEISNEKMVVLSTPTEFKLEKNYPNPFNPETTISYQIGNSLAGVADVKLNIYNSLGEMVCTLVNSKQAAGRYSVTWNGRDYNGNIVGSGIYFGRLVTQNQISTLKMMYMK